jgi:hypothetical protein
MTRLVFISHASKNAALAGELCGLLERADTPCWIAPRDIPAGSSYGEVISNAIEDCSVVVLLLTEEANQSKAVANELELAFRYQKVIVPVRLRHVLPAKSLEFFVSNAQWVDAFVTPLKSRVGEIVAIVDAVERQRPVRTPAPEAPSAVASLERFLEKTLRHKVLSVLIALIVVALLASVAAFYSSRASRALDADRARVDTDPSTFGLVTVAADPDADRPPGQTVHLVATLYLNLHDPDALGARIDAVAISAANVSTKIALNGLPALANFGGAAHVTFEVPANTSSVAFCISARHPSLSVGYQARWLFGIQSASAGTIVNKLGEPKFTRTDAHSC